ncbi:MAG: fasciclin domain-containing protein [Acidimicrobiia bacterium]|nr:fasciclin domain-containing protein [Acidimicrobiia bacterium]
MNPARMSISRMLTILLAFAVIASAVLVWVPSASAGEDKGPGTIVDIAIASDDFNSMVEAVVAADLVDALSAKGPFTVFAPTDEAFAALLDTLGLDSASEIDVDVLTQVLLYHVVEGKLLAADVLAADTLTTLQGSAIVVDAENVKVNDAGIIATDIVASNGVIHVIDAVLLPPADDSESEDPGSIVDIAAANPDFSTLVELVVAAGLADTLASDGPFTVFAPTNEAFENLPRRVRQAIADDPQVLVNILLYHVAAGELQAEDVLSVRNLETLEGSSLKVRPKVLKINRSNIIATDIIANNGVIHVIDRVLVPSQYRPGALARMYAR